jgi:NADH-quinone oxidoreductase subunit N
MNAVLGNIWIPSAIDLRYFSPELALVATLAALLIVPIIAGRSSQTAAAVALIGAFATMLLSGMLLRSKDLIASAHGGMSPPGLPPMLLVDQFSVFFKLFLMIFLVLVTWLWLMGLWSKSASDARDSIVRTSGTEFFVLLITSALGMSLMVSTLNLLVMVIAIETASLPSYAIVASDKRSRLGAEASLKYVLFGAATAAIMVYGVSLLYGVFGTLDIPTIAARVSAGGLGALSLLAFAAVLVGIGFKISAAPFHFWCPDVFEGAPIEVTTWLSVASKAAGLGLLLRIVSIFASSSHLADVTSPPCGRTA